VDNQNAGHGVEFHDDESGRMNSVICSVALGLLRDRRNNLVQSESGLTVNRSSG
jgi:hypothetical protein